MDVFSMPEVHIGKETFDCVVLCVDRHSGYVVAVPPRKKGLLAKEVAVMMIRHWLTVLDIPRSICSDRGPQFTGGWFKAMCSLMGIRHAKSVAYLSRSNGCAEVAGRQLFEKLRKIHITNPRRNWFEEMWPALKAHHDTCTPGGLSLTRFCSAGTPWVGDFPCLVMVWPWTPKNSSRGKSKRRGTSASSSRRSMLSVRSPPRAQQRRSSGWETRCG